MCEWGIKVSYYYCVIVNFPFDTGHSGLVYWDDPEGRDEEGGGREVQDGEHMYISGGFMSVYGKAYNIVK